MKLTVSWNGAGKALQSTTRTYESVAAARAAYWFPVGSDAGESLYMMALEHGTATVGANTVVVDKR